MRVLHVTATWFDKDSTLGGGERYPTELSIAMSKHTPTTLLSFAESDKKFTIDSTLNVVLLKRKWGSRHSPMSPKLAHHIRAHDIIHTHQYHSLASNASSLLGWLDNKKVFLSDLGGGGWNWGYYLNFNRLIKASLDISKYSQTVAERPANKHHIIYAGVDTNIFTTAHTPSNDYILFVGRILPHKGLDLLIKAMPSGFKLKIVGQPYSEDYLSHCKKISRNKNIEFIHDATDDDLVNLYQNALVTVLPSTNADYLGNQGKRAELFGLVLVESLACGTPVIASHITSLPEIITSHNIGRLFPQNDTHALNHLITQHIEQKIKYNPSTLRQYVLDNFTWKRVAENCLNIYRQYE